MGITQKEKIEDTVAGLLDYIYNGVKKLKDGGTATDAKNYIAALKSLVEMIGESGISLGTEDVMREGLKEFFGDLNESNEEAEGSFKCDKE